MYKSNKFSNLVCMKTIYFLLILIFVCGYIKSQDVHDENRLIDMEILKTDTLIKGIYMSFKEFQENNPSLKINFFIDDTIQPINYIAGVLPKNKLYILDTSNTYVQFNQKHWGICDGKRVLIRFRGKYLVLSIEGKYCQFTNTYMSNPYTYTNNFAPTYVNNEEYLLNITNDDRIPLTIDYIEHVLEDDNIELFNEFIKEKGKDKKLMIYDYINRLNKSYFYK
jgi:hypothetical protein